MEPHIPAYQQLGHVAKRAGPRLPDNTPNNLYPTRDGRHIQIVAITNGQFRRLGALMGRAELADDARFSDPVARSRNADAVEASLRRAGLHVLGREVGGEDARTIRIHIAGGDVDIETRSGGIETLYCADPRTFRHAG